MPEDFHNKYSPAVLVVAVVPQSKGDYVVRSAKATHASGGFIMYGQGTAGPEIWDRLGLTKHKEVVIFPTLFPIMASIMDDIARQCQAKKVNTGIVFSLPIDKFMGRKILNRIMQRAMQEGGLLPETTSEKIAEIKQKVETKMAQYSEEKQLAQSTCDSELIVVRMANGYGQEVMDCARKAGARGGTILHGRIPDVEQVKFFNITIEPEGDILFMLVNKSLTEGILEAIAIEYGPLTPAHAFGFVVPVLKTKAIAEADKEKRGK